MFDNKNDLLHSEVGQGTGGGSAVELLFFDVLQVGFNFGEISAFGIQNHTLPELIIYTILFAKLNAHPVDYLSLLRYSSESNFGMPISISAEKQNGY